jgi:hypothetical protein
MNNKHRIAKSIARIFYVALIYFASESYLSVSQLIFLSSACILFAPISDLIMDKISDDV